MVWYWHMPKKTTALLHKRIACILCHYKPKTSALRHASPKAWDATRPFPGKAHTRDSLITSTASWNARHSCGTDSSVSWAGKPQTKHPIHPYDYSDVSHIFMQSTWPRALPAPNLGSRRYQQLVEQVMNPESMVRDLQKVELYLKQHIRTYCRPAGWWGWNHKGHFSSVSLIP